MQEGFKPRRPVKIVGAQPQRSITVVGEGVQALQYLLSTRFCRAYETTIS